MTYLLKIHLHDVDKTVDYFKKLNPNDLRLNKKEDADLLKSIDSLSKLLLDNRAFNRKPEKIFTIAAEIYAHLLAMDTSAKKISRLYEHTLTIFLNHLSFAITTNAKTKAIYQFCLAVAVKQTIGSPVLQLSSIPETFKKPKGAVSLKQVGEFFEEVKGFIAVTPEPFDYPLIEQGIYLEHTVIHFMQQIKFLDSSAYKAAASLFLEKILSVHLFYENRVQKISDILKTNALPLTYDPWLLIFFILSEYECIDVLVQEFNPRSRDIFTEVYRTSPKETCDTIALLLAKTDDSSLGSEVIQAINLLAIQIDAERLKPSSPQVLEWILRFNESDFTSDASVDPALNSCIQTAFMNYFQPTKRMFLQLIGLVKLPAGSCQTMIKLLIILVLSNNETAIAAFTNHRKLFGSMEEGVRSKFLSALLAEAKKLRASASIIDTLTLWYNFYCDKDAYIFGEIQKRASILPKNLDTIEAILSTLTQRINDRASSQVLADLNNQIAALSMEKQYEESAKEICGEKTALLDRIEALSDEQKSTDFQASTPSPDATDLEQANAALAAEIALLEANLNTLQGHVKTAEQNNRTQEEQHREQRVTLETESQMLFLVRSTSSHPFFSSRPSGFTPQQKASMTL